MRPQLFAWTPPPTQAPLPLLLGEAAQTSRGREQRPGPVDTGGITLAIEKVLSFTFVKKHFSS